MIIAIGILGGLIVVLLLAAMALTHAGRYQTDI